MLGDALEGMEKAALGIQRRHGCGLHSGLSNKFWHQRRHFAASWLTLHGNGTSLIESHIGWCGLLFVRPQLEGVLDNMHNLFAEADSVGSFISGGPIRHSGSANWEVVMVIVAQSLDTAHIRQSGQERSLKEALGAPGTSVIITKTSIGSFLQL